MSDQSKYAEPLDPRIEVALREYLELLDRGEAVEREAFLARYPEIADALRYFIVAEQELRNLAGDKASRESAVISTRSFAAQGQETVPPNSQSDRLGSSLQGQFGRYQIIRALGRGAMGAVYLAQDTQLKRNVAIKTPHFEGDPTGELLKRFYREAESAATLLHANICPVYDVGEIDGKHFISMAYIEGRPLSDLIKTDKAHNERHIVIAVHKLASALQQAHDHGIVHRDLKPANIMINRQGAPVIMDFGLARKRRVEGEASLTHSGMLLGSPAYMSPEQIEADPDNVGPASDQYSLGVVLYEMITRQLPFRGSVVNVLAQILSKNLTRPSELRPGLDPRIEAVCLKMMAKKATDRFPSMTAVAEELYAILKSPAAEPIVAEESPTASRSSAAPAPSRRDAGTSQIRKTVKQKVLTESDVASLEELVRKCLRHHDYDQIIQIIERIPEEKRSAGLRALLEKSLGKADEIAFLICEIDEAERLNDAQTALKKAEDLLTIKPGHHRGRAVLEKYSGYGEWGAARIGVLDQFRRPINDGGWIPWSALAFGLAVFGVMTGVIVIYLGRTAVVIDIQDPGVEVAMKGTTLTVTGPDMQSVKVVPGDQELTITCAGLEAITKSFSIKKGEKKTVTVSILDKRIVAWLDNEIAPLPSPPRGTNVEPPSKKQLPPVTPAPKDETATTLSPPFKNSLGMEFVLVPKGKSWLGGGGGRPGDKEVVIDRDFYLGKYEVTQEEWEKVTGLTPSWFSRTGGGTDMVKDIADAELKRFPVEQVSWDDAKLFLERLNRREKEVGWVYRLPSAVEWEYACRGGPQSDKFEGAYDFYFDKPTNQLLPEQANFEHGKGLKRTCKVGSYQPNRLGLYDMHGDTWEWCDDVEKTADGASLRMYRGASWVNDAWFCRAAGGGAAPASARFNQVGLRVARVPVGQEVVKISPEEKKPADVVPSTPAVAPKPNMATTPPPTFKNNMGMEFVLVPKGKSWLGGGSGKPGKKQVVIAQDFYLGKYEVTQEEWDNVTGFTPSEFSRTGGGKDMVKDIADADLKRFPVENVSWDDAQMFLERLNKREQESGWAYRLPKEAEWEYACRGGPLAHKIDSGYDFYFDKPTNKLSLDQANFGGSAGLKRTCKVGSYNPNRLGLYDMHGNVFEWCDDADNAADGAALRGTRGGCWVTPLTSNGSSPSWPCRAVYRWARPLTCREGRLGLRVARVPVGKGVIKIPPREKQP